MRAKLFVLITLIFVPFIGYSQSKADSLASEYKKAKSAEQKIQILKKFSDPGAKLTFDEIPKAIFYNKAGLKLAKDLKLPEQQLYFLGALAANYRDRFDDARSLEVSVQGLTLAKQLKDTASIVKFLNRIFINYSNQPGKAEMAKSLNYGIAGLEMAKKINNLQQISQLSYNISNAYAKIGLARDSSLFYMQQSYQAAVKGKDPGIGYPLAGLANIEQDLKHFEASLSYNRLAIDAFKKVNNLRMVAWTQNNMAELYRSSGKKDSALHYAQVSYLLSTQLADPLSISRAAKQLSDIYEPTDKLKSLTYFKIATVANDSVVNAEKVKDFQVVSAKEQQRLENEASALLKEKEDRRQTLQLIAIGVFIPIFIVVVLLLSRTRISRRLIDFMGVLSLLMLFEFITLLIHPQVVILTHHTPALELMIFVAIAAVLVPLHHKLTHLLKAKLSPARVSVSTQAVSREEQDGLAE